MIRAEDKDKIRLQRKERILELIHDDKIPLFKRYEMAFFFGVPNNEKAAFYDILDELEAEGKVVVSKKGKIMPPDLSLYTDGIFMSTQRGFGFVRKQNADGEKDIYIPEDATKGARNKDIVFCKITAPAKSESRAEGEIVKIISRGVTDIVGTYKDSGGFGFVIPDDKKLPENVFISAKKTAGAVDGHKVVINITKTSDDGENVEGFVKSIIGHINDPGVDILSILTQLEIPVEFPQNVMKQTEILPDTVSDEDLKGRIDFRKLEMVTIDGDDAKDLDDAVSLFELPNGNYSLGVHIADVAHYVTENSPLDKEALLRGTSVYVPGRVVPMLPHKLSNGICSLTSGVDRLALSCIMEIDTNGKTVSHEIVESVIHINKRMSYTVVADLLTNENSEHLADNEDFLPLFKRMEILARILHEKRIRRGAVEFNLSECDIEVDEKGKPISVSLHERNVATNIIEEFMLVCNETVSEQFFFSEIPFVYRVHETPDEQKLENLAKLMKNLGYTIGTSKKKNRINVHNLPELMKLVNGTPEEALIHNFTLRSMKQAVYSSQNIGHFGLAAEYYSHFTSPIRRYPDLQIHRIIKETLKTGLSEERIAHFQEILPIVCRQCSKAERTSEEAEREADNMKKAEFMQDRIGNVYRGVISGVMSWGIYVTLENNIEGMISINNIPDKTVFDDQTMRLFTNTGKIYQIGGEVTICVIGASKDSRRIDFAFEESLISKQ